MEAGEVAVRTRKGEDLGKMKIADFLTKAQSEIADKVLN
jgi:threonyl-tRNA synthetase